MQPARGRFARFDLDRQMASSLPAHWKVGPAPVFWASQPLEPAEWLALLILKAGDVESNPGPQNRFPCSPHSLDISHIHLVLAAISASHHQSALNLSQRYINSLTVSALLHNLSSYSTVSKIFFNFLAGNISLPCTFFIDLVAMFRT